MEEVVYNVSVSNSTSIIPSSWTDTSNSFTTHYCGSWCTHSHPYYYYYNYSSPIYMYQIKCPKCKTQNWLPLDTITPCKKCASKLKAVSEQADFEIPVS